MLHCADAANISVYCGSIPKCTRNAAIVCFVQCNTFVSAAYDPGTHKVQKCECSLIINHDITPLVNSNRYLGKCLQPGIFDVNTPLTTQTWSHDVVLLSCWALGSALEGVDEIIHGCHRIDLGRMRCHLLWLESPNVMVVISICNLYCHDHTGFLFQMYPRKSLGSLLWWLNPPIEDWFYQLKIDFAWYQWIQSLSTPFTSTLWCSVWGLKIQKNTHHAKGDAQKCGGMGQELKRKE